MKQSITILSFFSFLLIYSCSNGQSSTQENSEYHSIEDYNPSDELIRFPLENYEIGDDFCYLNKKGDTIIPYGKYSVSYSDTIKTFGIVLAKNSDDLIGINQKDQRLYEIQWYDNGPDYIKEGLFRILRNGKTGYADNSGRIVIEPQFECAYPPACLCLYFALRSFFIACNFNACSSVNNSDNFSLLPLRSSFIADFLASSSSISSLLIFGRSKYAI